jgi:hypothetical protein
MARRVVAMVFMVVLPVALVVPAIGFVIALPVLVPLAVVTVAGQG